MEPLFLGGINGANSPIMLGGRVAGRVGGIGGAQPENTFESFFSDALRNVEETEAIKNNDSYNLSVGDMDDIAGMIVNSERAQAAFQLLMQMRNKLLDSYTEVMRINI